MGLSVETKAHLADIFASSRPHTNPALWADPALVMYGRQDTKGMGQPVEDVFKEFGYRRVDSIDVSDFEGCSIVHDLNQPVPDALHQTFNCVFDGGTLEHVFDVKTALFNTHNLLKPGGLVVHFLPVNNWINHGFYQFSPTLLYGFYEQNGYKITRMVLSTDVKGTQVRHKKFVDAVGEQVEAVGLSMRIILPQIFTPDHVCRRETGDAQRADRAATTFLRAAVRRCEVQSLQDAPADRRHLNKSKRLLRFRPLRKSS